MPRRSAVDIPDFCPQCGEVLPEGNASCPRCRLPEEANGHDSPVEDNHAYALLSAANLERMRGHWDAAVEKCVEALRLDPLNASAHSLVGDIYRDQGRREEAIQWFRMALDLAPENTADQMKLEKLQQPKAPPAPARPSLWVRFGVPSAVILAFLMMAVGIWALATAQQYEAVPNPSGEPPQMKLPINLLPGKIKRPTVPPSSAPPPTNPHPVETERETRLRHSLDRDLQKTLGKTGLQADTVVIQPENESAIVTLLYPSSEEPIRPENLLQTAQVLVAWTFNEDRTLNHCQVSLRYLYRNQNKAELVFSGATSRTAFAVLPRNAPLDVVARAFEQSWWNPIVPLPPLLKASPPTLAPSSLVPSAPNSTGPPEPTVSPS